MQPGTLRSAISIGDRIAGHHVLALLGRGGMGQVYLAEHPRVGRCAIKVARLNSSGHGATDVRREATLLAAIGGPHLPAPLGSGAVHTDAHGDLSWMSMRQIPGVDLTWSAQLMIGEVLDVARWVGLTLDRVHAAGIIHCDVKAANIMIERNHLGRVRNAVLIDFGIARRWRSHRHAALDPSFVGTLTTAPPEALRGEPCGPAADQYGLACTVYALLAGAPPFQDDGTLHGALAARRVRSPRPLGAIDADLRVFDAVLRRALANDPADRFPTCAAFASALRGVARVAPWTNPQPLPSTAGPLLSPATLIPT